MVYPTVRSRNCNRDMSLQFFLHQFKQKPLNLSVVINKDNKGITVSLYNVRGVYYRSYFIDGVIVK